MLKVGMLAGLLAVVSCGVLLPVSTSFPGFGALWPTLAALLVLVSGSSRDTRGTAAWLLSRRALVWLGGISYGVYLWHWPLLIWFRHLTRSESPGVVEGLGILLLAVLLAWATSRLVERPFGRWKPGAHRADAIKTTSLLVVLALLVGGSVASIGSIDATARETARAAEEAATEDVACAGAAAMVAGLEECSESADPALLRPDPGALLTDTDGAYDCYAPKGATEQTVCSFGTEGADTLRVAIVGNSHAAMLAAGIRNRVDELGWTLDTFSGNGCVWGEIVVEVCESRQRQMTERLMTGEPYDLLLVTIGRGTRQIPEEQLESMSAAWTALMERGTEIVVVEDNPRVPVETAECVIASSPEELVDGACTFDRDDGYLVGDRGLLAAERTPGVKTVELGDLYCVDGECPVVIGNVIVYRDDNHLTSTYVESLMPFFLDRLDEVRAEPAGG